MDTEIDLSTLEWRKSSASNPSGNCVEVAVLADGGTMVRHSKHPEGPFIRYTPDEWTAFIGGVKDGEFDR